MLSVEQISFRIGNKYLIENVSLEFSIGNLYGVVGPNGAGKSTLLKCIAGIWDISEGDVFWQGESLCGKSRRDISQTISLVPQISEMQFFDFNVEEIVSMGLYSSQNKLSRNQRKQRIEIALKKVDAWQFRKHKINNLSGGEKQRVLIARALVTEAPIMLFDEPTASLDIRHQLEIYKMLKDFEHKIIIVSLHDLNMAERLCDEIIVLNQGKCLGQGPFCQVLNDTNLHRVFGVYKDQLEETCWQLV